MKSISLKKIIISASLLGVLCVVAYNTKDLFFGTPFSVSTASDGTTIPSAFLPISGVAKHAATLEVNGRIVALDTSGAFSDGVVLSPGYNIVEILQTDRFGKESRKVFHLVAEPSTAVATAMNIHYQ